MTIIREDKKIVKICIKLGCLLYFVCNGSGLRVNERFGQ